MSALYITDYGAKLSITKGKLIVEQKDGTKREVAQETLDSIMILGNVNVTSSCLRECLSKGVRLTFLSKGGRYFGKLSSTQHANAERIKKQVYASDNSEFCLKFAQKIQAAKVHNQRVILKRYLRTYPGNVEEELKQLMICEKKIEQAKSLEVLMGYEGTAARNYFKALSEIIHEDFKFNGRSKQPPKDAFNSMLSFAYTLAFYEIYAELEQRCIDPYIGFVHQIKYSHPALVSDLLEEWRAVLVDSTMMSLVQGAEIKITEFEKEEESGAVHISEAGLKLIIKKMEQKMNMEMNYLPYLEKPTSFRQAIWWQVRNLARCIDEGNPDFYIPLKVR